MHGDWNVWAKFGVNVQDRGAQMYNVVVVAKHIEFKPSQINSRKELGYAIVYAFSFGNMIAHRIAPPVSKHGYMYYLPDFASEVFFEFTFILKIEKLFSFHHLMSSHESLGYDHVDVIIVEVGK